MDSRGIFYLGASPDVAEGIAAFKEKRAPNFGMRVSSDMPPFFPWWRKGTSSNYVAAGRGRASATAAGVSTTRAPADSSARRLLA